MISAAVKQYPTGIRRTVIVATCIIASLLELIDSTIVNVSLHHIAGSLGASTTDVAWIITAYAISNVIIIPLTTMLSERFGRRRYYIFSIMLFTFASFMCGNSDYLVEMVIWRFIQGLGGGALLSLSQSILLDSFPPEKINVASAIYGMGVAMGPAIGPTLGGVITDSYSWNWIFFINVPLGIIAAIAAWVVVSNQRNRKKSGAIDWTGIFLLTIGIGSLQYVLEEGNSKNWFQDRAITILAITAVVGIILFVIIELKAKTPAVNLRLLRHGNLAIGILLNFGMLAILFIGIYAFPLMAQIDLGWTATMTGLALVPGAIITSLFMVICQKLIDKGADRRILIAGGFFATFVFSSWFSVQSADSSWCGLFWPLLFRGAGVGLYMLPAITMAVEGFKGSDRGHAVSLSNMARQLGGAVGLALIGTQISNSQAVCRNTLISHISEYNAAASQTIGQINSYLQSTGMTHSEAGAMGYAIMEREIARQSSLLSYLASFRIMAVISLAAIFAVFLIKRKQKTTAIRR
ncbi:MAG: DHA2 family efflux MFS transporter permease subunit [Bacteroidales bacterium]|jgi:DHA2 family multidrug resistance protein|nr:DHA2 family efflux MFS transporter permease subunit [Bacteroidales bacterium]